MEGNTSLKRKEGHEADEAKAQGTLAAAAAPPKHKKARTEEENTKRGKGAAEQVRHRHLCRLFLPAIQR
jgi:hypothetical protein